MLTSPDVSCAILTILSVEAIANDMDISTSLILDEVWSEINILFEKGLVR